MEKDNCKVFKGELETKNVYISGLNPAYIHGVPKIHKLLSVFEHLSLHPVIHPVTFSIFIEIR